jgi:hypothetical protein
MPTTYDNRTIPFSSVLTAAALRGDLEALGLEGEAVNLVVDAQKGARVEARIDAVVKTALAAVDTTDTTDNTDFDRRGQIAAAIALCLADMVGVGGRQGLTGEGTARVEPFRTLGKGRKQAYDGPAWSQAVEYAVHRLLDGLAPNVLREHKLALGVDPDAVPFLAVKDEDGEVEGWAWLGADGAKLDPAWTRALVGNALLALGRGETAIAVGRWTVAIEGTPANWGKAFNAVADAR